jgi:hypothetical protein
LCPICKEIKCLPECPRYEGISIERGKPIAYCEDCGGFIYEDDSFFELGKFCWCAECAGDLIESNNGGKEKNAIEED